MNGTSRKIEIFAPFSAAMDLTKLILFQPFDIAKWLVIGFAAFLANLAGGGGNGANFNKHFPTGGDWRFHSVSHDVVTTGSGMPGWLLPVLVFGGFVLLAIVLLLLWVGSRGRFIFADCVVRNRAAIVLPWREFRREGNSFFLFSLLVGFVILIVVGLASLPLWLSFVLHGDAPGGAGLFVGIVLVALVMFVLCIPLAVIATFMVPVMYRRRCNAAEGFRGALALVSDAPGPVILFVLFQIVLRIAFAFIACLLTCVTCCITAIPYVGTVILLPIHVFLMAYLLLFVRQFGPDYDPWANVVTAPAEATMIEPPSAPPPSAPPAAQPPSEPPPFQT